MGNIKMKFAKKLLISLTIMMTLLSLIENKRSKRALPPRTEIVLEGGVCQRSTPPRPVQPRVQVNRPPGWTGPQPGGPKITYKCAPGLVCAAKPSQRNMTGINMYCQKPRVRPTPVRRGAKLGEVCGQPSVRGAPKIPCEAGLKCKAPSNGMKGAPHTCQRATGLRHPEQPEMPVFAEEGEVCSRPVPNFQSVHCRPGLECRPHDNDRNLSGVSSYCLPPAEDLAQEGEVCSRPTPDFKKRNCEMGLVCRPRDGEEMLSGVSSICQGPKIHIKIEAPQQRLYYG